SCRDTPPCTLPFPYTTLFRSILAFHVRQAGIVGVGQAGEAAEDDCEKRRAARAWRARSGQAGTGNKLLMGGCGRFPRLEFGAISDRKSTRLNSSHQIISYADF